MMSLQDFVQSAFEEDVAGGDYSTLACIPPAARGKAVLKVKEQGLLAGMEVARAIFEYVQPDALFKPVLKDGDAIQPGDMAFEVEALVHTILKAERLVLNAMQRMSGIATLTRQYVEKIKGSQSRILDTRKTTPLFRRFEKEAVRIGGGFNHRMGLYDMIMLKDNHIDYCGGIAQAIHKTKAFLKDYNLDLKIEVETRNPDEIKQVLEAGPVHRIMLDNFSPQLMEEGIKLIDGRCETEASGGITLDNIEQYAATGVDYISVGALTHHAVSLDLSLKAV